MIVTIEFKSGAVQESYGIREVRIDNGHLVVDGRRIPLEDVSTMKLGGLG